MSRGYLLTGLSRAWGKRAGLALMAGLFALPHLTVSGAAETHWLLFTVLLSLPGLVLGWTTLRAGSLWLPMGIRFAWDLAYDVFSLTGGSHPRPVRGGHPPAGAGIDRGHVVRRRGWAGRGPGRRAGRRRSLAVDAPTRPWSAMFVVPTLVGRMTKVITTGGVWLWTRRSPRPCPSPPAETG